MSQNSVAVPVSGTVTGLAMAQAVNLATDTLASNFLGAAAPSTTYPGQWWIDTGTTIDADGPWVRQRNSANSAWLRRYKCDMDFVAALINQDGTAATTAGAAPAFTFTTKLGNSVAYAANQRHRIKFNAAGTTGSNTLSRDGLANINLKQYDSTGAKVAGVVTLNMLCDVEFDGTDYVIVDPLPPAVSNGRTTPNFVNSSCMIAQRSAATINLSTSKQIGQVDNIAIWASGGAVSAGTLTQISSAISGATGYASRAAGVTLTGSGVISHQIYMEAKDAIKYKNKTCSFSVKVDHDVGSNINYTLVAKKANSADNFSATTTLATGSATPVVTATGTTLTLTGVAMGDCSNGIALEVQAACGAVTTKNFNVDEFQIDVGASAQTYVAPDEATERARCQRQLRVFGAADGTFGVGSYYNTTSFYVLIQYATMRVAPSLATITAPTGNVSLCDGAGTPKAISAVSTAGLSPSSATIAFTTAAASAGQTGFVISLSGGLFTLSAEVTL